MAEETRIELYCPMCNVLVDTRVEAEHVVSTPQLRGAPYAPEDLCDCPHDVNVYALTACLRCEQVFLVRTDHVDIPGEFSSFQGREILHPQVRSIELASVPEHIRNPFREALEARRCGLHSSCVVMCRKAIEGVCHHFGIKRGKLVKRIEKLREAGHIDERLGEWADGLRLLGNDAAHDFEHTLGASDAADALEFAEAILLYVFTLRTRFEEFKARRAGS